MKQFFTLILCILLLASCNGPAPEDTSSDSSADGSEGTSTAAAAEFAEDDADMFTNRDLRDDINENGSILITLNGSTAACSDSSVKISGGRVTITKEATYILEGKLDDGMIIVDAEDTAKLQLVFRGVDITSSNSAPLYILEGDKIFLTLAPNSTNTLSTGGSFTAIDENNIDAAIFSKQDLTINGSGALTVNSPVGHGIVSKDDLVITGGDITVNSASHALDANDSVRITNAGITAAAGKDGIHAENSDDPSLGFVYISGGSFDIDAEGDGISAGSFMQITGGSFDILTGGGSVNGSKQTSDNWGGFMGGRGSGRWSVSTAPTTSDSSTSIKGLKSTGDMLITGGSFTIDSADDSVHSNASVTVNGGTFEIASGDDAFHADDTLTVTTGKINVTKSYEGLEGLHIAVSGGDIKLVSNDDGLNAAGGTDSSGTGGRGGDMFGGMGGPGGTGGMGGMRGPGGMGGMSANSDGSITISGGNLHVNSSGDGIDANGTLTISGGYTVVVCPTQGDTATLDYDISATITGGTFIGTGASGMAQTFSDSEQGVIAVSVGSQSAGTKITLTDKEGNTLISYTPELSFQVVILSSPDMVIGETYTITVGSQSGEFAAS